MNEDKSKRKSPGINKSEKRLIEYNPNAVGNVRIINHNPNHSPDHKSPLRDFLSALEYEEHNLPEEFMK